MYPDELYNSRVIKNKNKGENVRHRPFKKVFGQYTEILDKCLSEPVYTFFLGFGVLYLKI